MIQTILTAAITLLLISPSYGSLRSSNDAGRTRRLIQISFNNKLKIDWSLAGNDVGNTWKTGYNGDYEYNGMVNGKPSYRMTTCRDPNAAWPPCRLGTILSVAWNGHWQFGSQTNDPFCFDETETPQKCTNWWEDPPTINEIGTDQFYDNGVSQQETAAATAAATACSTAAAQAPHHYLTQTDKDLFLQEFNTERTSRGLTQWTWSPALDAVAQATANMCQSGHPLSGDLSKSICEQNNGGSNCWAAGIQGTQGPVSGWDERHYLYNCPSLGGTGIVKGLTDATDGHQWPILDQLYIPINGVPTKYLVTEVACAYADCGGRGNIACNYK